MKLFLARNESIRQTCSTWKKYVHVPSFYTANVYRALSGLCRVSWLWGNTVIFTDCGEILQLLWGFPSVCKYYRVYPQHTYIGFLCVSYSPSSAVLPCRNPLIPIPNGCLDAYEVKAISEISFSFFNGLLEFSFTPMK